MFVTRTHEGPRQETTVPPEMQPVIDLQDTQHGPLFLNLDKEERNWVLKMHRNLGHPGHAKLMEHCKHLGCPKHIVTAIPHLRCATCLETSKPSIPRPSAIHEPEDFGDTISMDGVTWTNHEGKEFPFLPLRVPQHFIPDCSDITIKDDRDGHQSFDAGLDLMGRSPWSFVS